MRAAGAIEMYSSTCIGNLGGSACIFDTSKDKLEVLKYHRGEDSRCQRIWQYNITYTRSRVSNWHAKLVLRTLYTAQKRGNGILRICGLKKPIRSHATQAANGSTDKTQDNERGRPRNRRQLPALVSPERQLQRGRQFDSGGESIF